MPGLLLRQSTSQTRPSVLSSPSPSPSPPPTIHRRRIISRANLSSPPPPILQGLGLSSPPPTNKEASIQGSISGESDAECWLRMLALQREFHCYNSARLEAAVEALEMGWSIDEVPIPSRLCLNLLNEGLKAHILENQGVTVAQGGQ